MTMSVQSTTCTRGFIPNARNIHYWLFSRALAAIRRGPTLKTRASPSCRNVPTVLIWPVRCVRRWLRLHPGFRQQPATPVSKSPRQPHPVRGSQGPALSTSMLAYRPPSAICEPPIPRQNVPPIHTGKQNIHHLIQPTSNKDLITAKYCKAFLATASLLATFRAKTPPAQSC